MIVFTYRIEFSHRFRCINSEYIQRFFDRLCCDFRKCQSSLCKIFFDADYPAFVIKRMKIRRKIVNLFRNSLMSRYNLSTRFLFHLSIDQIRSVLYIEPTFHIDSGAETPSISNDFLIVSAVIFESANRACARSFSTPIILHLL